MVSHDTIAALATAPGEGAIAIVRLSGPASLPIADALFRCKGAPPSQRASHTFVHGAMVDRQGVADEVILLIYRAPASYTREDVVEIQGHGGAMAAQRVLRAVLEAGARLAEPGEFTKRAFLNGRIDLLQAEAVMDLIRARSERSAHSALEQLDGEVSRRFTQIYNHLLESAGIVESALDFPEDELPPYSGDELQQRLASVQAEVGTLIESWGEGHLLREGASIVIMGRPNAGKSTLMNALLGRSRAIVTPHPGTTRDTIEEQLVINGYMVTLVDTAGLRDPGCEIEREGIRRAHEKRSHADLVIYVIDGSHDDHTEDEHELENLESSKTIIVLNKCDTSSNETNSPLATIQSFIRLSAITGVGLYRLREAIIHRLASLSPTPHRVTISERHRTQLVRASQEIDKAKASLHSSTPDHVLASAHIRTALEELGIVTGRIYHDELLDNIFSRFCIGK